MSVLTLRPLAERAEWVDCLAQWHFAEWGALYGPEWSLAAARAELAEHAARGGCPGTFVAERGDLLLGSVSVVEQDAEALRELGGPWLASLYVRPEARGRGIARQLVRHAEREAKRAGFAELRLFTPQHADYYAALGWRATGSVVLHGTPVMLMRRSLVGSA